MCIMFSCRRLCDVCWLGKHKLYQQHIQQGLQHSPLHPHSLAGGRLGGLLRDLC